MATPAPRHREQYDTLQEVADFVRVHPRTVRKWIASGRIKAYRGGAKRLLFKHSDVLALIQPRD